MTDWVEEELKLIRQCIAKYRSSLFEWEISEGRGKEPRALSESIQQAIRDTRWTDSIADLDAAVRLHKSMRAQYTASRAAEEDVTNAPKDKFSNESEGKSAADAAKNFQVPKADHSAGRSSKTSGVGEHAKTGDSVSHGAGPPAMPATNPAHPRNLQADSSAANLEAENTSPSAAARKEQDGYKADMATDPTKEKKKKLNEEETKRTDGQDTKQNKSGHPSTAELVLDREAMRAKLRQRAIDARGHISEVTLLSLASNVNASPSRRPESWRSTETSTQSMSQQAPAKSVSNRKQSKKTPLGPQPINRPNLLTPANMLYSSALKREPTITPTPKVTVPVHMQPSIAQLPMRAQVTVCNHVLDPTCDCPEPWSKYNTQAEKPRDPTVYPHRYTQDRHRDLSLCYNIVFFGRCSRGLQCSARHWKPKMHEKRWMDPKFVQIVDSMTGWDQYAPDEDPFYQGRPRLMRDGNWCINKENIVARLPEQYKPLFEHVGVVLQQANNRGRSDRDRDGQGCGGRGNGHSGQGESPLEGRYTPPSRYDLRIMDFCRNPYNVIPR